MANGNSVRMPAGILLTKMALVQSEIKEVDNKPIPPLTNVYHKDLGEMLRSLNKLQRSRLQKYVTRGEE